MCKFPDHPGKENDIVIVPFIENKGRIPGINEHRQEQNNGNKVQGFLCPDSVNEINHEVRTCLNAIMGFSQILNFENVSAADKHRYLGVIYKETDHLLRVFDRIMKILLAYPAKY